MRVEIFPAKIGDSFLVSYGKDYAKHILIDAGYAETYQTYIKPRLLELKNKGQKLRLVIVSHIDRDHILGVLQLIKENGSSELPKIIKIQEVWHNSYKHLQNTDILLESNSPEEMILDDIIRSMSIPKEIGEHEISAYDGSMLASYLREGNYNWNLKAIQKSNFEEIMLDEDLKIIVLSPSADQLENLKYEWEKQLKRRKMNFSFGKGKKIDDAFEFYMLRKEFEESVERTCSYSYEENWEEIILPPEDKSCTNSSSIALILETKKSKSLFLGDVNPSQVAKTLEELKTIKDYSLDFNIIKISHHGSIRSTNKELLELINGKKWIFTGTGEKGKPSKKLIKYILSKKKKEYKEFIFSENIEWLEELKSFEKEYNFKIIITKENEECCTKKR